MKRGALLFLNGLSLLWLNIAFFTCAQGGREIEDKISFHREINEIPSPVPPTFIRAFRLGKLRRTQSSRAPCVAVAKHGSVSITSIARERNVRGIVDKIIFLIKSWCIQYHTKIWIIWFNISRTILSYASRRIESLETNGGGGFTYFYDEKAILILSFSHRVRASTMKWIGNGSLIFRARLFDNFFMFNQRKG